MEPITIFLIMMQAAGTVTSMIGARAQQRYMEMGRKLSKEQLETNLLALKLKAGDESLDEMVSLRKSIGSQIAYNAALGRKGGSAVSSQQEAYETFRRDERRRELNLSGASISLKGQHLLEMFSSLNQQKQMGFDMAQKFFNTISTSGLLMDRNISNAKGTATTTNRQSIGGWASGGGAKWGDTTGSTFNWGI